VLWGGDYAWWAPFFGSSAFIAQIPEAPISKVFPVLFHVWIPIYVSVCCCMYVYM